MCKNETLHIKYPLNVQAPLDMATFVSYFLCKADSFKAGFRNPFDLFSARADLLERVATRVSKSLNETIGESQVRATLQSIFQQLLENDENLDHLQYLTYVYDAGRELAQSGYFRTNFTSALVGQFIQAVRFVPNESIPALSKVELEPSAREQVEVLKHFSYESIISSPDLKVVSYRGRKIVTELFGILMEDNVGNELLPRDFRKLFYATHDKQVKSRVVCDFISSMTDKYAIEYFGRLTSESPQSLFKKLA